MPCSLAVWIELHDPPTQASTGHLKTDDGVIAAAAPNQVAAVGVLFAPIDMVNLDVSSRAAKDTDSRAWLDGLLGAVAPRAVGKATRGLWPFATAKARGRG